MRGGKNDFNKRIFFCKCSEGGKASLDIYLSVFFVEMALNFAVNFENYPMKISF